MKGKYEVLVRDARIQYKFTITRNVTILRGDSATGKTTLINMISAYQQDKESSGVTVLCEKECVVLTSYNWQLILSQTNDKIVFIDEGASFVKTEEFANLIKKSSNYYVIATRTSLFNIPYSIKEIYGIKNKAGNKYQRTKRLYSEFYPIYKDEQLLQHPDLLIVEDSNAGFEFYDSVCKQYGIKCISANGKTNVYRLILESDEMNIAIVADGAAFGPEIESILAINNKNISLFLPESFEWIILKSGLIKDVTVELENPENYIESSQYFSWERFFTELLIERTNNTYLKYNKKKLNVKYLQKNESNKILKNIPLFDEDNK